MARDPNKPTRMDGILNNIPSVMDELSNRLEQTGRLREYSHATSKNPDKILENWMRPNQVVVDPMEYPVVNLSDFEGRGFVLGESDRAIANRRLEGIGDKQLAFPIDLNTGSNFIFHNPQVWSSGASPITKMFNQAVKLKDKTKQNPIMLPRLLGPQGVDFDKHIATTQLSYNLANSPTDTLKLQDDILRMFVPGWKSASDPASMAAFYELPADVRKKVQIKLDSLKNQDGLSLGNARVALTNPAYIDVPNQFLPAVAEIDVDGKITKNQNINYPVGLQGQGLGLLSEPLTANELVSPDGELSWGEKGLVRPQDTNFYFQRADTSGILDRAYLNRLSDAGVKFRSPGAVGIIAGTVATIMGTGYSGQEVEAGVIDTAKKVVAADAKTTQRANTVNTAKSAAAYLKNQGASGKSLDYGAGHGINAKAMGFDETFEPFAGEGFTPTYTSGQDIPRGAYGQIVSTNVLNVIPPTDVIDGQMFRPRDMAVLNIGDALQDGGMAVIQTRSASAVNELKKSKTAIPQDESGAFVTSRGSYQKGFTRPELQEYVQGVLGDGFGVEIVPAKDISAGSAVKVVKLGRFDRATAQGFDMTPEGRLYHASKQDIPYMKPGYGDGLVFTTPDPEFANQWLGKGMYRHRDSGGSIDGLLDEKARFNKEANEKLNSLPESERDQYYQDFIWPKERQLLRDIDNADSTVYPLVTRTKNPFRPDQDYEVLAELYGKKELDKPVSARPSEDGGYDTLRDLLKDGSYVLYEDKKVVDFLKSKGYDSMFLKENAGKDNPFTTLAVFDGGDLRSPSAQFKDPSSRNLLAGGTSAAVGTGLLGTSEESDASFVGAFSKLGASRADLKGMAIKMEAEGLSPTEIRGKTGWYKGAQDRKWRTELPNTNTKINLPDVDFAKSDETQIVMRLDDVVDDAELLSQYDVDVQDLDSGFNLGEADFDELDGWRTTGKLGNIQVVFDSEMPPGAGGYGGNTITVSALSSPQEQRAIILHEIQHAIQERELFAGGANPSTFEKDKFISDMWNESLEKRLADLDKEYLVKDQYGMSNLSFKDREARDSLRLMKMLADRFRQESAQSGSDDPFDMYLASAGEVEARNVELRDRAMSPSGLLKVAPFETESVPSANQIFRPEDDPIQRFKNIIDERYNSYRQPDPTLTLDDDFARMQQNADGGIINQMMAKNARSQQLAEYGDALKSRRKLDSVSKMINKRLDSKGPLVGEIIARETENFTKLIVGLVPMIASPDSTFYQDVTQSKSLLGDPSEGYNTVMDTIAKGMQTYVLEPAKKALDYKGSDDKSVRQEIAETIQPAIDAYKTLPETVQEEVMPRLGYLGALVGSLYGFGLANKAKQTVRQGQSGEGVLGRFSPIEGELVDTPTPAIDVRQPAGLLQQKMLKSANNRSR